MGNNELDTVRHTLEDRFEFERIALTLPQVTLPVKHIFSPGVYARELTVPAGCIVTGAVHKYEHINILSKGRVRLLTEYGTVEIEAPHTMVAPAGSKEIGIALTDTVWTTIVHTFETDVSKIEKEFVCKTEQEYLEWHSQSQLSLASPVLGLVLQEP